ncbi:integrase core domain-containing protein [Pseudomonas aeruginosa]|uniref:integrase core domain-containing protein n=2 Tax=Pseudomonas aeruginosa TaxID=287 RepID=UPI00053D22D3|nr:integrase core domain-containing protein [Pseudomonas aeruginosa]SKA44627.1 Integrase core domain-containing protein [Pseudomonas aeruginosa DSM 50071 = NBRC 12689]KMN05393.1 hypothetical protein TU83_13000 [Pseudomonas aeruginosa]MCG7002707.1 integrase core domain-containing protein [Pseudomonas aeruginosa]MCG7008734.1 integrase core domain-containing protein [Pseudomonas aeruginosa]MCO3935051.1 transposase [Pseudomonas aeruginosa]
MYCPLWPERPFDMLEQAKIWANRFVDWYNHQHRHRALKFVTPAQRHAGQAEKLLKRRIDLYEVAHARQPERWSGNIRNWPLAPITYLNPELDMVLKQTSNAA